jgi:hypothetical protein
MNSEHENLDQELPDDTLGLPLELMDPEEPDELEVQPKPELTTRARLEALRERRALQKAIYDDLYYDDDLGEDN